MRYSRRGSVWLLLIACSFAIQLSCSSAPVVCKVTPIDIEEMKADSRDLDIQLADAQDRLRRAKADLARWQTRIDTTRTKPPLLRAELEKVKKASGVTPKVEETTQTGAVQANVR